MKADAVDFRLLSLYPNSWSATDLELLYQIVVRAVGNSKEASHGTSPHAYPERHTSSVSLKKRLPLFRTSGNIYWQPCTQKWFPFYQPGGGHLIKTSLSSYRNKSARNTSESIAYQCFQPPCMDTIVSSSIQSEGFLSHPSTSTTMQPTADRSCTSQGACADVIISRLRKKPTEWRCWPRMAATDNKERTLQRRINYINSEGLETCGRWGAANNHQTVIIVLCDHESPFVRGTGPSNRAFPLRWNCSIASRNTKRGSREHYHSSWAAIP